MEAKGEFNPALVRRTFRRPFIFSIFLFSAMTYFVILTALFLAGIIFSQNILDAVAPYELSGKLTSSNILFFLMAGSGLYLIISAGLVMFVLKRRLGFYLFLAASLALMIVDFIYMEFDWIRYLAVTGFIFILGIMHFSGKCYPKMNSLRNK